MLLRSRVFWAPVRPSHCCVPMPHFPCALSGTPHHCWCVEFFDIGCWQISGRYYSCCQAPNLPWAPIYRLLMLLVWSRVCLGPCTASHCCCLHAHTLPFVPLSGLLTHCWCVEFFD
ncbi:unnamed protein product, partial [Staurois parvus]